MSFALTGCRRQPLRALWSMSSVIRALHDQAMAQYRDLIWLIVQAPPEKTETSLRSRRSFGKMPFMSHKQEEEASASSSI